MFDLEKKLEGLKESMRLEIERAVERALLSALKQWCEDRLAELEK